MNLVQKLQSALAEVEQLRCVTPFSPTRPTSVQDPLDWKIPTAVRRRGPSWSPRLVLRITWPTVATAHSFPSALGRKGGGEF